jgi:hypothetical protein
MPTERQKTSDFRSDLKEIYGDKIKTQLLEDAYKTNKKPYDFYTVWFGDRRGPARILAWEAKKIDGMTFNFNLISGHQMEAHNEYNYKLSDGQWMINHVFNIYILKLNVIAVLDPLNVRYILETGNQSIKFGTVKTDTICYYSNVNSRTGELKIFKREKTYIGEKRKTVFNAKGFFEELYGQY